MKHLVQGNQVLPQLHVYRQLAGVEYIVDLQMPLDDVPRNACTVTAGADAVSNRD